MKRALFWMIPLFVTLLISLYLFPFSFENPSQEAITFFPIDQEASFQQTATVLHARSPKSHHSYSLSWTVSSSLNEKVYLRQDISLLFADGRLMGTLSKWREADQSLRQERSFQSTDSHFFQAISFHYGEIHRGDTITSSQKMSGDQLYVIASPYSPFTSFRHAKTANEKEWQRVLNKDSSQLLKYTAKAMIEEIGVNERRYYHLYLPELLSYNEQPFPDLSQAKTQAIIGNLWEGLYKNYFLGIKQKDGSITSPIGSTVPLLLISKDYSHLIILTKTKNGETVQLRQHISP
ncbi:hypothetical protein GRQ40_13005 [Anoxybacillus sp. PDR2]|uniref:hypothetical protein n=1 Tax=Anoxybacillus sp. PDR2 TaxID=1636720 RepID=UPI001319545A|nr:hypothetical protein [Anoxybacillus sp. PDR2]QHC04768.1 hypothetical protein GRQ40_13005 [Anoxybacillus sp. PDR2]